MIFGTDEGICRECPSGRAAFCEIAGRRMSRWRWVAKNCEKDLPSFAGVR
jgi:hypothetical protein